jgi:predicted lipoprotein with Yx(FWY)xxD motif
MNPGRNTVRLTVPAVLLAGMLFSACQHAAAKVRATEPVQAAAAPALPSVTPLPPTTTSAPLPQVRVEDQSLARDSLTVASVTSPGAGWMVIHADKDGKPGAALGYSPVLEGVNTDVRVTIDASQATARVYAMLHIDAGTTGVYEFPGDDQPVMLDGAILSPAFDLQGLPPKSLVRLGGDAAFGAFLVDASGMTLYTFTRDSSEQSACTGDCAAAWPPLLVENDQPLTAGEGLPGTLGTITRMDGTLQLTYNGLPLYTYAGDAQPGDASGQGLNGAWFVVLPDQQRASAPAAVPAPDMNNTYSGSDY